MRLTARVFANPDHSPSIEIDLAKILNFKENDFHVEENPLPHARLQRSPCPHCITRQLNGGSSKDGKLTVMASFYPCGTWLKVAATSVTSLTPDRRRARTTSSSPRWSSTILAARSSIAGQSAVDGAIRAAGPQDRHRHLSPPQPS